MSSLVRFVLAALIASCVIGCDSGSSAVIPRGQLLVAGAPYDQKTSDPLMVIFYPSDAAAGDTYPAIISDDGTFEVTGRDGEGIPPGSYHVSIEAMRDTRRTAIMVPPTYKGNASSMVVEVKADMAPIPPIDVTK